MSKPYPPSVVRFFILQAHYRSILDFSDEALAASEKGFYKLLEVFKTLEDIPTASQSSFDVLLWKQSCYDAMNDDFNSPILIAQLFEAVKAINSVKAGIETLTKTDKALLENALRTFFFDVLGLEDIQQGNSSNTAMDGVMQILIDMRAEARANRNWALSDKIRDELDALGIQLKDGKDGTTYTIQ